MKKILMGLAIVSMAAFAGCGVGSVVSDINSAIAEQKAQVDAEAVFEAAITQVTGQVLAAAFLAEGETVDASETDDSGATYTTKGSAVATTTGTAVAGTSSLALDVTADWANLKVTLGDDTVVTSTGSETAVGTWNVNYESGLTTATANGSLTLKGTFTVNGKSNTFEVVLTLTDTATSVDYSYTGTVNTVPVLKTTSAAKPADNESIKVSCQLGSSSCVDYIGSGYTGFPCGSPTVEVASCDAATTGITYTSKCVEGEDTSSSKVTWANYDVHTGCSGTGSQL